MVRSKTMAANKMTNSNMMTANSNKSRRRSSEDEFEESLEANN